MSWNWQDISALLVVGVASIYVATRVYRRLRRRETAACDSGCTGCHQAEPDATQVVTLGTSVKRRRKNKLIKW